MLPLGRLSLSTTLALSSMLLSNLLAVSAVPYAKALPFPRSALGTTISYKLVKRTEPHSGNERSIYSKTKESTTATHHHHPRASSSSNPSIAQLQSLRDGFAQNNAQIRE